MTTGHSGKMIHYDLATGKKTDVTPKPSLASLAPLMLAALEAEESAEKHYDSCLLWYCSEFARLRVDAKRLRTEALAKARGA